MLEKQTNRLLHPSAVPVVFTLGAVLVVVGNAELLEQSVGLLVLLTEVPVPKQNYPLGTPQLVRPPLEQLRDLVLLEVLQRPKYAFHPELVGLSFMSGASQATAFPKTSG